QRVQLRHARAARGPGAEDTADLRGSRQRLRTNRLDEQIARDREARADDAGDGAGTLHRAAGEEARPQRLRDLGLLEERREPLAPEPDRLRRREEARL